MGTELYDDSYYASIRGFENYSFFERILESAGVDCAGKTILDVGCGRGEMVRLSVRRGARRVVGLDSSPAGIELARRTLEARKVDRAKYELVCAKVEDIKQYVDDSFDCVLMIDFVEHVSQPVLIGALRTVHGLLNKDGIVVIHTFPNRHLHTLLRFVLRLIKPELRTRLDSIHVNVQTAASLQAALAESGYDDFRTWIENDLIFASSFYLGMRNMTLKRLARLLFYDIFQLGFVDRFVRLMRLDHVCYMSIYGVART